MGLLRRCLLALCVGGLMLPVVRAAEVKPAPVEASLIEAESKRFDAQIAGDIPALTAALADEVVYTHASGKVQNKTDYLQGLKSGAVHYQGIEVTDRVAHVYGNFGLTVGTITLSVGGDRKLVSRYTGVYAQRDGRWQLLSWQATDIHAPDSVLVYIGTHGIERPSEEQIGPHGIYAARLDTQSGKLSPLGLQVELQRATWLTLHPQLPIMYSVANAEGGMAVNSNIHAFALDGVTGKLKEVSKVDAGGRDATHLDFDVASSTLFSANHGTGSVTALPIRGDGSVGPVASSQSDYGTGPNKRQKKPAAHGVVVDPSHRYVLVADFSADRIFVYRFDPATRALTPAETPFEATPAGSGPRHLVFHPNGKFLYLTTELTAELRTYRWDAKRGRLALVNAFSAYPAGYSGGTVDMSAAEVALSRDGKFLYVSLRGDQDSIVGYEVNGETGMLKEIQRLSSQGKMPWSFAIDPTGRWMLVTNEASNSVNVFKIDPASGKLGATQESLRIPKPLTVTFYRP